MIETVRSTMTAALLAQAEPGVNVDVDFGAGLAGGAVGAFATTLVVGAIMIAVAPEYTERTMEAVLEDPVDSFVYGIFWLLALVLLTVLLVFTVIGIVAAVPLIVAAVLVWAVGAAVAYLAIADRLVGKEDGWLKPLLVGAAINGALALTGIGGIVSFGIGAAGFGAVLRSKLG